MTPRKKTTTMTADEMRDAILNGDTTISPEQLAAAVALEQAATEHAELTDLAARRKEAAAAAAQLAADQEQARTEVLGPLTDRFEELRGLYAAVYDAHGAFVDALHAYAANRSAAQQRLHSVGIGHEIDAMPTLRPDYVAARLLVEIDPNVRIRLADGSHVAADLLYDINTLWTAERVAQHLQSSAALHQAQEDATRAYKINAARDRLRRANHMHPQSRDTERAAALAELAELGVHDPGDDPRAA